MYDKCKGLTDNNIEPTPKKAAIFTVIVLGGSKELAQWPMTATLSGLQVPLTCAINTFKLFYHLQRIRDIGVFSRYNERHEIRGSMRLRQHVLDDIRCRL